jgi:proteasome accessory factor A
MPQIMGMERETTILRFRSGRAVDTRGPAEALMEEGRKQLTHLRNIRNGIFTAAGDRFYIDAAHHPEWSTAECTNPTDVVCHVRAGERHLETLVDRIPDAVLLRGNVSYGQPSATWGTHENHSYKCARSHLRLVLRAHLLTRIVFTGSGGLDPFHPGIVFTISPRSLHFDAGTSCLHAGACLDGRDETLAKPPYERAHIVLGESVSLNLPLWLGLATTSLIVALTDADVLTPSDVPRLRHPADALRAIALDPELTRQVETTGGRRSALEVQRQYLELVEAHVDHRCMPDWAPLACARWRAVLDELEAGGESVPEHCEWALKLRIMTEHLHQRGFDWTALKSFNATVERVMARHGDEQPLRGSLTEWIITNARPRRYSRQEVRRFLKLRAELCAIDMRYAIYPGGIHDAIKHRIPEHVPEITEDRIRHAMKWPPDDTRAEIRGRYIRRLSADHERYVASWTTIRDLRKDLRLDLTDPFCRRVRWKKPRSSLRARILPRGLRIPGLKAFRTTGAGGPRETPATRAGRGCRGP